MIKSLGIAVLLSAALCCHAAETYTAAKHGGAYPAYPMVNYGTGDQAALIKKGEYLVKAGDCLACHTNHPDGKPFAGGLPIETPFGTIYSQNITPDKDTGIGKWTDQEFIRALRHGVAPDGSYYFPVFPFIYYNKLSDQDALAIRAYLNAVPAVHQENIPPKMPIPFRWRFLQIFWRIMFFHDAPYQLDTHQSAEWNRGKFLVDGLGHCGMCHTPLNFLGAEKKAYYLTGGFVEGFYAPNITSTNLSKTPVQDVVNVFLQDKLIGGGDVQGPMLEVNHDSLKYLSQDDLKAMVTYLQTVKSKEPPKPKPGKGKFAVGKNIYDNYCTGCHTTGAGGAPKLGDTAAWSPLIQQGMNVLYKNAMTGIGGMPAKGACSSCSMSDIQAAVDYIVSKSKPGAAGAAAGPAVAAAPSPGEYTSLAKGKQVYEQVCSVCHQGGQLGAPKLGDRDAWNKILKQQDMDILFTRAIRGYNDHPPRGACHNCSDADILAAVKYMVQQSTSVGDYRLW